MSSLCLWFVPWLNLSVKQSKLIYHTHTHTHRQSSDLNLKVRLKQTLSESNSGCFLRPGPPPHPPTVNPPQPDSRGPTAAHSHVACSEKAACVQVNIPPVIMPPPHVKVTPSGGSGGSKHSQRLWEAGGVQTEAAAFWLTLHRPLPQTCCHQSQISLSFSRRAAFWMSQIAFGHVTFFEKFQHRRRWSTDNLRLRLKECSWKQQESHPSSNPLISYLYGADEEEVWAEEKSGDGWQSGLFSCDEVHFVSQPLSQHAHLKQPACFEISRDSVAPALHKPSRLLWTLCGKRTIAS